MARIRTVKPEYWTDERVGECSPTARLLLIATWNFADDHGSLERSAKQLKAQAFPYDQIDCEPLIQELLSVGILVEYQVNGKKYLHIKGFSKHQKIEKKALPRYPVYQESTRDQGVVGEGSPTTIQPVEVSSLEWNGMEGKGRDQSERASEDVSTETEIRQLIDSIKGIYPKAARQDWITAEKLIRNLVRDGTAWGDIIAGVERYSACCRETRRLVQNPGIWFGAVDRPWLQEWPIPETKDKGKTKFAKAMENLERA